MKEVDMVEFLSITDRNLIREKKFHMKSGSTSTLKKNLPFKMVFFSR